MSSADISKILEIIKEVSDEEILPRRGTMKPGDITYKSGMIDSHDAVTAADDAAEKALTARLSALFPGAIVFGEEAYSKNPALLTSLSSDLPVFIIDPLDGTKDFANGGESFYILVSCIKNKQIVAGFIFHPISGEAVVAERGGGAYYKNRKLNALTPVPLSEAHGTLGRRVWSQAPNTIENVKACFSSIGVNPNSGLAAPKLLLEGKYFGSEQGSQCHFRACPVWSTPWDDAPSLIVYEESGGKYANWEGEPYQLDRLKQGLIMAPDLQMIEAIRKIFEPYNLREAILSHREPSRELKAGVEHAD